MIKNSKFTDADFQEMYKNYSKLDLTEFKKYCINLISLKSVSSNEKKTSFSNSINFCKTKDTIVQKMTNFYLAGEGHKVWKSNVD